MKSIHRVLILVALAGAIGAVFVLKHERPRQKPVTEAAPSRPEVAATHGDPAAPRDEALPRLVDLGAGKCIPCKMMAPILEELSRECADTFAVEFIDVWENPEAGEKYDIRMIPTQIFYDAAGNELFRHEGFFGKEEIVATWKEYGVAVATTSKE